MFKKSFIFLVFILILTICMVACNQDTVSSVSGPAASATSSPSGVPSETVPGSDSQDTTGNLTESNGASSTPSATSSDATGPDTASSSAQQSSSSTTSNTTPKTSTAQTANTSTTSKTPSPSNSKTASPSIKPSASFSNPLETPFKPGNSSYTTYLNPAVPKAAYQAKTIYYVSSQPAYATALTLASLQGLMANKGSHQILVSDATYSKYSTYLTNDYKVEISRKDSSGNNWSTWNLLRHFKDKISGYILCNNTADQTGSIATTLANQLNAVVVTKSNESRATEMGLKKVLDVTDKNDSWLRNSSGYFSKLNKNIAVEQPTDMAPRLFDYAVMSNAYINFSNSTSKTAHTNMFSYLNPGALVFGYNNTLGEFDTVDTFSSLNIGMIPSDHALNLSTLSGFRLESIKQKTASVSASPPTSNRHTVCFVVSDGDNVQWIQNNFTTSKEWFGSSKRGSFNVGWGLPPTFIDLSAPMTKYLYNNMSAKDEYIMQLSGLGYTFPSRWNRTHLEKMAVSLNDYMKRMNLSVAEILDDKGFSDSNLSAFTKQDAIKGLFYIDYGNYAQYKGQIIWSNNKPIISARYRLWAGPSDGSVNNVANNINNASKNPTSASAYSFVIVHAWSGLNSNGQLVANGNTMDAIDAVISKLGSNIDVVTPSEFVNRIVKNNAK